MTKDEMIEAMAKAIAGLEDDPEALWPMAVEDARRAYAAIEGTVPPWMRQVPSEEASVVAEAVASASEHHDIPTGLYAMKGGGES